MPAVLMPQELDIDPVSLGSEASKWGAQKDRPKWHGTVVARHEATVDWADHSTNQKRSEDQEILLTRHPARDAGAFLGRRKSTCNFHRFEPGAVSASRHRPKSGGRPVARGRLRWS